MNRYTGTSSTLRPEFEKAISSDEYGIPVPYLYGGRRFASALIDTAQLNLAEMAEVIRHNRRDHRSVPSGGTDRV